MKNWDSRNRCEKHHHHPSDDHFQCGSLPVLVNHKPQWLQRIATGILMTVVEAKMQFPQLTSLNGPAQNHQNPCTYLPTSSQGSSSNNMFQNWQYQYYHIHHNATHDDDHHRSARSNTYQHKSTKRGIIHIGRHKRSLAPELLHSLPTNRQEQLVLEVGKCTIGGGEIIIAQVGQINNQSCNQSCSPHPSPPPPPTLLGLSAAGDGSHGKMAKSE